jgi:hypothetical protein
MTSKTFVPKTKTNQQEQPNAVLKSPDEGVALSSEKGNGSASMRQWTFFHLAPPSESIRSCKISITPHKPLINTGLKQPKANVFGEFYGERSYKGKINQGQGKDCDVRVAMDRGALRADFYIALANTGQATLEVQLEKTADTQPAPLKFTFDFQPPPLAVDDRGTAREEALPSNPLPPHELHDVYSFDDDVTSVRVAEQFVQPHLQNTTQTLPTVPQAVSQTSELLPSVGNTDPLLQDVTAQVVPPQSLRPSPATQLVRWAQKECGSGFQRHEPNIVLKESCYEIELTLEPDISELSAQIRTVSVYSEDIVPPGQVRVECDTTRTTIRLVSPFPNLESYVLQELDDRGGPWYFLAPISALVFLPKQKTGAIINALHLAAFIKMQGRADVDVWKRPPDDESEQVVGSSRWLLSGPFNFHRVLVYLLCSAHPFHCLAASCDYSIPRLVLKLRGPGSLFGVDSNGLTAAHVAALYENFTMMTLLYSLASEAGISLDVQYLRGNKYGMTPVEIAEYLADNPGGLKGRAPASASPKSQYPGLPDNSQSHLPGRKSPKSTQKSPKDDDDSPPKPGKALRKSQPLSNSSNTKSKRSLEVRAR